VKASLCSAVVVDAVPACDLTITVFWVFTGSTPATARITKTTSAANTPPAADVVVAAVCVDRPRAVNDEGDVG
jgi:hypothetical protein